MRHHAAFRPMPSRQRGFTLIELMVAMIILVIGILALASTTAVTTRHMGGGAQMARAAAAAQTRFERLRAEACETVTDGSDVRRGITEKWTVTAMPRAVEVALVVSFDTNRGSREHEYKTLIPCPELL